MARIAGVNIPTGKRVPIALTYIHGIGDMFAKQICEATGIDLTRRVLDHEIYGMTSHLLTTSDGKKMGKTADGAVWLNADMTAPYAFWQFWRNTTDADTGRFLKLYTELPVEECDRLGALQGSDINAAKIILANEVTTLLHGAKAATAAEATAPTPPAAAEASRRILLRALDR